VKVIWVHSFFTRLSGGGGEEKKIVSCDLQNSYSNDLTIDFKFQIYFPSFKTLSLHTLSGTNYM